jgi:hypothetical protein
MLPAGIALDVVFMVQAPIVANQAATLTIGVDRNKWEIVAGSTGEAAGKNGNQESLTLSGCATYFTMPNC